MKHLQCGRCHPRLYIACKWSLSPTRVSIISPTLPLRNQPPTVSKWQSQDLNQSSDFKTLLGSSPQLGEHRDRLGLSSGFTILMLCYLRHVP